MATLESSASVRSPFDPADIARVVSQEGGPAQSLADVARFLRDHLQVDVCSIYLVKPDRARLVLAATVGLSPDTVGKLTMRMDEGLTGLTAEQVRPVAVENGPLHPRFKFFPDAGEEPFRSFLGVPILDQGVVQGVLIVQTRAPRKFSENDTDRLVLAATHIASVVSEARMLDQFVAPTYERVWTLARNLWWSWDPGAQAIFRELGGAHWEAVDHNPVALLREISLESFDRRARKHVLQASVNYTYRRLQEYLHSRATWGHAHAGVLHSRPVAYFSAEFGLHESLPIYSGGLGMLAGDHLKSASDLGIPLVGVGLFYGQGYFRQHLSADGWQEEAYLEVSLQTLPLELTLRPDGEPVSISIETRTGEIHARVWRLCVGRVSLYLLDSNVPGNAPEDRALTSRLYGGDQRVRIRQELLLGVGGVRALDALGIAPGALHLNEGHSAFALLERVRERMASEGLPFDEALRRVARHVVFTTHTPVPAGHDCFDEGLIEEHLGPLRDALDLSLEQLMGLGRVEPGDVREPFCMTVLALRGASRANAVSSLHGQVSRAMWRTLYRVRSEDDVPIGHITNGVHVPSWIAPQMRQLFDRHLGPDWVQRSSDPELWTGVRAIDDGELWETHLVLKALLLDFVRDRIVRQAKKRGESEASVQELSRALSLDALTIGFARRFATYKRANLLFHDLDRIAELLEHQHRPVQIIFAGKAHPRDVPGKEVLREIARLTREPPFRGNVVFVEDYDIDVGRHLVQGVDVWLNSPRRPLEASGTSGMKGVLNGALNLSIMDGWWAEAYDGQNGFAIGSGMTHVRTDVHDRRDADALYSVLENDVVPLYYQRDEDGIPSAWVARVKAAIETLGWRFNANRMVLDYVRNGYVPAAGGTSTETRLR
jgi:starch phosphorylase